VFRKNLRFERLSGGAAAGVRRFSAIFGDSATPERYVSHMPYRNMSLEDLAAQLGMDPRAVRRLAEKGTLPGMQVGGHWRFNSAQMLDWLQREMHTLTDAQIRDLERAMSDVADESLLAGLIPGEGIDLNLPARSRASLLRELVGLAERTGLLYDPADLLESIEQREALQSTALPGGLALPHARRPMPHVSSEPLVCVAYVPAGIAFGAPDGRTTDVFVLIVSHEDRGHLRTLARIAQVFRRELLDELRSAADARTALEHIIAAERALLDERA
jgi:nitrogen PTS system EIIA component